MLNGILTVSIGLKNTEKDRTARSRSRRVHPLPLRANLFGG